MIEMDEGMDVYTMKAFKVEEFVFDIDYEFDAAQYFDFSQPETSEDTMEAERWFESAAGCPPSRKHVNNFIFCVIFWLIN